MFLKSFSKKLFPLIAVLLFTPLLLGFVSCQNLYWELADKNTDAALAYQAKMHIDKQEYSAAISVLNTTSLSYQQSHDGRLNLATAYAGRCGLNLISLAETLADMGSSTLFKQLMLAFKDANVSAAQDCLSAENLLKAIPAAQKTPSDHVFLAFVAMSKSAAYLAQSNANDGIGGVDVGFDACSSNAGDGIAEDDVKQIGSGLMMMLKGFEDSGSSALSNVTSVLTGLCSTFDNLVPGGPPANSLCDLTEADDFGTDEAKVIRTMLLAEELGLNTCGGPIDLTPGSGCSCF
jgi:hypothetical protein